MSSEALITQIGTVPFDGGIGDIVDRRERKALEEEVRQAIASSSKHPVIDKAVEQALGYSFRLNCAFLPDLYRLGESLLNYIKKPFKPLCLDAFKDRAKGRDIVKVQIPGPQTVFSGRYGAQLLANDETSRLVEHGVIEDTLAQGDSLLEGLDVPKVILFFDEPELGGVGREYVEKWLPIFETFSKVHPNVIIGIHTCYNAAWDTLFSLEYVSIISCNWSEFGHVIALSDGYKNRKKAVARGIEKLEDIWDHRKGDLITPPCGLATKSVAECYKTLDMLLNAEKTYLT